ncbi:MAG: HAMP domain-containing sensor histidine kinase [Bacteroidota bacterium]
MRLALLHTYRVFLTLSLGCFLIGLALVTRNKNTEPPSSELAQRSLSTLNEQISSLEADFIDRSIRLKSQWASLDTANANHSLPWMEYDFWGIGYIQSHQLVQWSGYTQGMEQSCKNARPDQVTSSKQVNNVRYFEFVQVIGQNNCLITRVLLDQQLLFDQDIHAEISSAETRYPVQLSLFGERTPSVFEHQIFYSSSGDTLGLLFAEAADSAAVISKLEQEHQTQQIFFFWLSALFVAIGFFFWCLYREKAHPGLTLMVSFLTLGLLFVDPGISNSLLKQIFILIKTWTASTVLMFWALHSNITKQPKARWQVLFVNVLQGILLCCIGMYFWMLLQQASSHALLDLITTDLALPISFFIYVCTIIAIVASTTFAIHRVAKTIKGVTNPGTFYPYWFAGFTILLLVWIIVDHRISGGDVLIFLVLLIGGGSFIQRMLPGALYQVSRIGALLWLSLLSTVIAAPTLIGRYYQAIEEEAEAIYNQVDSSGQLQADDYATELVINMRTQLETNLYADFKNRLSVTESTFDELTQNLINELSIPYSVYGFLTDEQGNSLADYSTALDTPDWGSRFRLSELTIPYEEEQLRLAALRPVIRYNVPENPELYTEFARAWIPLPNKAEPDQIAGWIVCMVFAEKPQFQKPLRSVLAPQWYTSSLGAFSVSTYRNNKRVQTFQVGSAESITSPDQLPEEWFRLRYHWSALLGNDVLKFVFPKTNDSSILVAKAPPGAFYLCYIALRLFVVTVFTSLFLLLLLSPVLGFRLFGYSRTIQQRLTDRFILTSLFGFLALVGVLYFAIQRQQEQSIKREVEAHSRQVSSLLTGSTRASLPNHLQAITNTLRIDANVYLNDTLALSTAPEVFSQFLIPNRIPFGLVDTDRTVTQTSSINGKQLITSYTSFKVEGIDEQAIVGIPTFTEAPTYQRQLIDSLTLTMLILFGVFSLFVGLSFAVSRSVIAPLKEVRKALGILSQGNLNHILPERGNDEIAQLSRSYNAMLQRLRELQIELGKTEREAAWKEMAQQVAHEIKNPLTPMKLNIQHLLRQISSSDDQASIKKMTREASERVIEQINFLDAIASDFSSFSKPLSSAMQVVNLEDILTSIVDLYSASSSTFIHLEQTTDSLPRVTGSEEALRRAFLNLIKNALEAVDDNGGKIHISLSTADEHIIIQFEDNGAGIDESELTRIFEPSFSTKSSGTGLGLAITKRIIEAHDGLIFVNSQPGEGTLFKIELPLTTKTL